MDFRSCSIIIPVIRETDLFEQVVQTILNTCNTGDIEEFIVVVHPEYTARESYKSIKKMEQSCKKKNVAYQILNQTLPGVGGAMRDALDIATGSHTIILNADMASDPYLVEKLIRYAKECPSNIISVSRYISGGKIESGYKKVKLLWNTLSQKYCAFLYQSKLTDYTYMYRICPTKYYQVVIWKELRHPFALETTLKFLRLGLSFQEIPGKQIGGSQSGYLETLTYLPTSIKIRFMRKRRILKSGITM